MKLTNDEMIMGAFMNAVVNDVANPITWEALSCASSRENNGWATVRGDKFDQLITAAIRAGDLLDRAVKSYRPPTQSKE